MKEPPLEARYKEATMSDLKLRMGNRGLGPSISERKFAVRLSEHCRILQAWVNCKHFANLPRAVKPSAQSSMRFASSQHSENNSD